MLVMPVQVVMLNRLVDVLVLVALSDVQPHAQGHQDAAEGEAGRDGLSERHDRGEGTEERSCREVRRSARGPEVAQGPDEQHEADAVPKESDGGGTEYRRRGRELCAQDYCDREIHG